MNISEGKGHKWLQKQGYKEEDILFQRKGIDFLCADGKGYEVKRLYGHVIWFHLGQLERTRGKNNSVLVFDDDKEEPIAVLPSMELEKDKVISGIKITIAKKDYQAGYKTINIKEELIEKIRTLDENKKEIEEGRFNLAGFVTKALLEYMNRELIKYEGPTTEQVKDLLSSEFRAFFDEKNKGNTITGASTNEEGVTGLSKEDIKRIATEMLLEVGMHIETGVANAIKELR